MEFILYIKRSCANKTWFFFDTYTNNTIFGILIFFFFILTLFILMKMYS